MRENKVSQVMTEAVSSSSIHFININIFLAGRVVLDVSLELIK